MSRSGAKSGGGKDERSNAQKVDDKLGGMNKTAAKAMKGDLQKGGKDKSSAGSKEGDDKVSALKSFKDDLSALYGCPWHFQFV